MTKRLLPKGVKKSELWLFKNKEAIASVRKGLKEAGEGKLVKRQVKVTR